MQIFGNLTAFERMTLDEKNAIIAAECHGLYVSALGGGDGNAVPILEILQAKYVKFGELSVQELRSECIHPKFLDNPAASKILLRRVMAMLAFRFGLCRHCECHASCR